MTHDEFLETLPFLQGVTSSALMTNPNPELQKTANLLFLLAPRYFALADLARRHPEEYAKLVQVQIGISRERYGDDGSWDNPSSDFAGSVSRLVR